MSAQEKMETVGDKAAGRAMLQELEKYWGALLRSDAVDFYDGRKVILLEFERGYTFRLFNPNVNDELHGIQINLSRETVYALTLMYMVARQDERDELDRPAFWHALADDQASKMRRAMREIGEMAIAVCEPEAKG